MATTTTTTTPTGWAADAAFSNWQKAQQIAAQPYQQYQGNMLAGWNDGQMTGYNTAMNSAGIGIPSLQQAQGFATQAGAYQPQQVTGGGYAPAMQAVTNTGAASAGPAAQTTPAQMTAANAGPAHLQNVLNTRAFSAGPAARMDAAGMTAASAGPARQMQAATMNRGDVRNVAAGNFTQANLDAYMNPYIGSVVNSTLGQLGRQNDIINNTTNARATAAGAFGGGRQAVANAENNRAFLDTAGQVTSNLYNTGFNTAQGAIQADQNRALQADLANQGQDWNVGSANLGNRQAAGLQNMLAGNQMSQFNAGLGQAANLQNAGFQQAANAANQAATNSRVEYNVNNQQNAENATIAAHNAASQSQAQMANQMQQYNAGLQQQANAANAGYGQEAGLWNAGAQNNMSQYNAGLQQTANSQTAAAHNTASQNQALAYNQAQEYGLDSTLRAQLANQQAGQNATNSQIQAANALNGMGLDAQTYALNNSAAQFGAGNAMTAQQQLGLDQQYNQWAAQQNYPMTQLGILQSGLNGYNSGQTQTAPYYSNTGAQIAAGALGAGALGAGILANGSQIASGASSLYNGLSGLWGGGGSSMPNALWDTGAMGAEDLLSDWAGW